MADDITNGKRVDKSAPMTVPPSSGEGVRACPPPLEYIREDETQAARITQKRTAFKVFTKEEKAQWKTQRRSINAHLSKISRSWIDEAGLSNRFIGLMSCGSVPLSNNLGCGSIMYRGGSVAFNGLNRCGSSWGCPECAGLKLWKTSKKIARLLEWLGNENRKNQNNQKAQYCAVLLTLTVPHRVGDSLKNQVRGFSDGFRHLMNSRKFKKVGKSLGYCCSIRAYDMTVRNVKGVPDWHTHLHCLLIFKGSDIYGVYKDGKYADSEPYSDDFIYLRESLWGQWSEKSVKKCFGDRVECSPCAFGLENIDLGGSAAVADYVAKVVSCYISGGSKSKGGVDGRYTPFELLSNKPDDLDFRKRAWLEYIEGTKGRNRINFSRCWRDSLGGYVDEYDGNDGVDDAPLSWSFNPSADLVAAMRLNPSIKETVLNLAAANNPAALILSLVSPNGGGSPSLVGSFFVDVDGSHCELLDTLHGCDGVRDICDGVAFVKPVGDGSKPSVFDVLNGFVSSPKKSGK